MPTRILARLYSVMYFAFLPHDAMLARSVYDVVVCLSVCVNVSDMLRFNMT